MAAWGALLYLATTVRAEEQIFDFAPIHYATAALSDPISDLQKRMAQGNAEITFDDSSGYLPSLLKALNISPSSQILVFSRTSFQIKYIGPKTPRAIYFGDGIQDKAPFSTRSNNRATSCRSSFATTRTVCNATPRHRPRACPERWSAPCSPMTRVFPF